MKGIPVAISTFSEAKLQTPLYQKGKTFYQFSIVFLNCGWNLQRSENEEEYTNLIITEIIASERDVYLRV